MHHLHTFLCLVFAGNGLAMLGWPAHWYLAVPGVADTGPLNAHFVRDVGAAYLVAGLAFGALRAGFAEGRPAAFAACGFLFLHAAIHLAETVAGLHGPVGLLRDLPAVVLLPLLAAWSLRGPRNATAGVSGQHQRPLSSAPTANRAGESAGPSTVGAEAPPADWKDAERKGAQDFAQYLLQCPPPPVGAASAATRDHHGALHPHPGAHQ